MMVHMAELLSELWAEIVKYLYRDDVLQYRIVSKHYRENAYHFRGDMTPIRNIHYGISLFHGQNMRTYGIVLSILPS